VVPINGAESIHVKEPLAFAYQSIKVMMVDSSLKCQNCNSISFGSLTVINIVPEAVWISWVVDDQRTA
jgi:hypothetical protein